MTDLSNKHVAVVGGGPAGLMAADVISAAGARVTVFERMPSAGRKMLMAGRGGLNLTHSEPLPSFLTRYGARAQHLTPAIDALTPTSLTAWCEALGQPTFVGSSGRVFPKAMKTSPLLRAWLRSLAARGVVLETRHKWTGFSGEALTFATPAGERTITADAVVLALGGGSWPELGSDGRWVPLLEREGIEVAPLQASNCGFLVAWSDVMRTRFEGQPLKRVALSHGGETQRGEVIVTATGLEGGALYALSPSLRSAIAAEGSALLSIDLRPDLDADQLAAALAKPRGKQSLATFLRKAAQLMPAAIGLLQEAAHVQGKPLAGLDPAGLAAAIKAVAVRLEGLAPMKRAISTAGGVAFEAVSADLMLKARPGVFVAGEMLDWDAPTGGYLLQACFATGAKAGRGVLSWLGQKAT